MPPRMNQTDKNIASGFIKEHIQDDDSLVSQAMAWGAFKMLGRLYDHRDVYDCLDIAQSDGHEIRNPISMMNDRIYNR